MIKNDRVYGAPLVQYKDTKANIAALSGVAEGAIAYATDTDEFGSYNGTVWTWGQGGGSAPTTTAANDFQVGDGSGNWVKKTLAEVITILRTSLDSVYAAISHTHAASDITSGTLNTARLPVPTTTTLGGVARNTGAAGEYVTGIDASGNLEYDTPAGGGGGREILTADRTYYVRTDGSDTNDGLANTSGGAFLTIQKAVDVLSSLDVSTYNVTVQTADGTYVAGDITLKNPVGSGSVIIQGNTTTPTNVVIDGGFIKNTPGTVYKLKDFRLTVSSSSSVNAVLSTNGAYIEITGVNFHTGYSGGSHLVAEVNGAIALVGSYTISGGAQRHFFCRQMGVIRDAATITITLSGTPAFSQQFTIASTLALVRISSVLVEGNQTTFSGSATGTRYLAAQNGVINTAGGGANYFPGNAAGSTASGGQYV